MIAAHRLLPLVLLLAAGACAGSVVLPNQPGGGAADISSNADRELYLQENPDLAPEIRDAVREGVFAEGMTLEQRDAISNSDRRGTTGYGYWRSRDLGDEVRYQWYVANVREPFDDGRGRAVCELVYREGALAEVRYCSAVEGRPEMTDSIDPDIEDDDG